MADCSVPAVLGPVPCARNVRCTRSVHGVLRAEAETCCEDGGERAALRPRGLLRHGRGYRLDPRPGRVGRVIRMPAAWPSLLSALLQVRQVESGTIQFQFSLRPDRSPDTPGHPRPERRPSRRTPTSPASKCWREADLRPPALPLLREGTGSAGRVLVIGRFEEGCGLSHG